MRRPAKQLTLVSQFRACVHVQHCFEPAAGGRLYRRVVAARLAAAEDVVLHVSEFSSRQLHQLSDLLLSCLQDPRLSSMKGPTDGVRRTVDVVLQTHVCMTPS